VFQKFIQEAHKRGLKVIIDMVLNHTSDEHEWFKQSKLGHGEKKDFYLWTQDPAHFPDAIILNSELCTSNWEPLSRDGKTWYYLHRFLSIQPDLNYLNPNVLFAIMDVFLFWMMNG
jgi:maltose alpha-D-glucosyltransferase/alpha-amylase